MNSPGSHDGTANVMPQWSMDMLLRSESAKQSSDFRTKPEPTVSARSFTRVLSYCLLGTFLSSHQVTAAPLAERPLDEQAQSEKSQPVAPKPTAETKPSDEDAAKATSNSASDQEMPQEPATPVEPVFVELIVPDLNTFWKCYNADATVTMADVWKVTEPAGNEPALLICKGKPKGFLYTSATYADFELTLEWRFPTDANGNSGVLVYLQDEPRIWPTSMQIQFHQPKAGSVFPSGDAKSANTSEADLAGPVNSWNTCRIVSKDGRLSVEVNGKKAGETTGAIPSAGSIALQSEGAEVHFRRIRIRQLAPDEKMPDSKAPASPPANQPAEIPGP